MSIGTLLRLKRSIRAVVGVHLFASISCCLVHTQASPAIVSLEKFALPGTAEPGVTLVTIVGSGFPSGTISVSNVQVQLQPAVPGQGSAMVAAVSAVTTLGAGTRAVSFKVLP